MPSGESTLQLLVHLNNSNAFACSSIKISASDQLACLAGSLTKYVVKFSLVNPHQSGARSVPKLVPVAAVSNTFLTRYCVVLSSE